MSGISREVIEHNLEIDPSYKPVKQKKEDTHQRGEKPSGKKSINYLKPSSLGQ
jgi:hypothetical protein